ncbi:MAG: hypothetical protein Q7S14_02305 [bacterium]|nr:hypothetical protein [bacterium]
MAVKEKIAIFEDEVEWAEVLKDELEAQGHTVKVVASTRSGITEGVADVVANGFSMVFTDGNLDPFDASGKDGSRITQELKTRVPSVVVLGYSTAPDKIVGTTRNFNKTEDDPNDIATYVTNLPVRS